MKRIIIALLLLLPLRGIAAIPDIYNYTYYQMEDGLCDNYIFSTYEDSFGFMWFCTANGLDRFDGYEFVHYSSASSEEPNRINSNFVKRVVEDGNNHLWIISDVGLMRINLLTGIVETCDEVEIANAELLSQPIQALYKDKSGNLWLGIAYQVVYVHLDDAGEIEKIDAFETDNNVIISFTQQENTIWAGGHSGINKFAIVSNQEVQPIATEDSEDLKEVLNVQAIFAYGAYLWIGTQNGLYFYDTHKKQLKLYQYEEGNPNGISGNNVTSLAANHSGDILIGTRNGINIYTRDNLFEHIQQGIDKESINTDLINDIYVSENGSLWVGTSIAGVNLLTPKSLTINHLLKETGSLENIIGRIFEDKQGNLFVGIINKGLAIRYAGEKDFRLCPFSKTSPSLVGHDIRSIKQDDNNNYWIATTEGLHLLKYEDLKSPTFTRFTTENSSITSNVVSDLAVDSLRNGIWLCHSKGVDFMNLETHGFTFINCALEGEKEMPNLFTICLDSRDKLWLGGNGLYIINLALKDDMTDQFPCEYYRYKLDDQASKISERISSIIETEQGDIYIGSQNNGLYVVEKQLYKKYTFNNIPLSYASSNLKISNIQEDKSGNLWISTLDGIFYYDTALESARKFDHTDGLPKTLFYIRSGCMLQDGSICFGTKNGFLNLSLPARLSKAADRKVVISHIQSEDRQLASNAIERYDVYPEKQSFEVFFSALRYVGQSKISYSYKMDKLDKKWNICTNQNNIRYTGLPPGNYTLRVRCTNADNFWSENETILSIKVHPYFYQTTWFWLLILFGCLLMAAFAILWYVRHQKEIQRYLKEEVLKRTQNLVEQKAQLEEKKDELNKTMEDLIHSKYAIEEQNQLLQSQNLEINKQKDQIELFSQKMEKVNKDKLMLFTHLTHEFKTPLTLILGPVHKLGQLNKNPRLVELVQVIERNAQYLLLLLNQIIDLRRLDAQELTIKEKKFDIEQLIKQDISDFTNLLSERHLTLELMNHMPHRLIKSDRQFVHTILFNLISNAVKYTPNGGKITLRFAQSEAVKPGNINQFISITNTGSYIEESERENIFECFYKIENQTAYTSYGQSSTGIGLFLIKRIVDALNGHISIKSSPTKGTTFRVCFPTQWVEEEKSEEMNQANLLTTANGPEDIPFTVLDDNKPILLIAEDNKDMREYIKGFLEKSYNIAEAINGERGFELAKQIIPDFIISDMMMSGCDGVEFCKKIRAEESLSHIPFLMLTALSDDDSRIESYKEGVDAFITKPFDPLTLLVRIDNLLKKNKVRQKELSYDLSQAHSSVLVEDADKLFLEKLTRIMESNYTDPNFCVSELLDAMGMSSTSFYKKIIALTGLSASHFIRLFRLQTAKKIIDGMEYGQAINISEIAYMVGFNDPKYFTRCFVKQYKVAPSTLLNKK